MSSFSVLRDVLADASSQQPATRCFSWPKMSIATLADGTCPPELPVRVICVHSAFSILSGPSGHISMTLSIRAAGMAWFSKARVDRRRFARGCLWQYICFE